jgi:hypothetical protein
MYSVRRLSAVAAVAVTVVLAGCTSTTAPSTTTTTTLPRPVSTSLGGNCGPDFFSPTDQARVIHWFGRNQLCQRWTRSWVVLLSPTMNAKSPGGAVVLVDVCRAGDTGCLNGETPHPLTDFTAYPLPDPTVIGAEVLQYVNDTLFIGDSRCGGVLFDLRTDHFNADGSAATPSFPMNESPLPKASRLRCKAR